MDRFPQLLLEEGQLNDMPQCEESVDWGLKAPRYRLPESTRQPGESLIRPMLVRYEESLT